MRTFPRPESEKHPVAQQDGTHVSFTFVDCVDHNNQRGLSGWFCCLVSVCVVVVTGRVSGRERERERLALSRVATVGLVLAVGSQFGGRRLERDDTTPRTGTTTPRAVFHRTNQP